MSAKFNFINHACFMLEKNNSAIIFDRIRENMAGIRKQTPETLAEVANRSLTQTLPHSCSSP